MKRLNLIKKSTLLVAGAALALSVSAHSRADSAAVVVTEAGAVKGLVSDHREFRGVPFARPPIGQLRWRAPQPAQRWAGLRDATAFASACPQSVGLGGATSTDEDCLYLNVYTPLKASKLPVMVWIPGGSFTSGLGSIYDPSTIVSKGNVVAVTLNYRVGALGFLATPALAAENRAGASGNYGVLDQQAALRWVQQNIKKFGGDPDNVTIFGESAGGSSVCMHLVSPPARGLFHKAISESGACNGLITTPAANDATAEALATATNCKSSDRATELACLRALSADAVVAAQGGRWNANIDGLTFLANPSDAIDAGKFIRVPYLAGFNANEGRLFAYPAFELRGTPMTAAQYTQLLGLLFGPAAAPVLNEYPLANYPAPIEAWSAVIGDSQLNCTGRTVFRKLAAQNSLVYAYEFTEPNPPSLIPIPLGPTHGTEIPFVFQKQIGSSASLNLTPQQLVLSNQMLAYWTNFAKTGNPNRSGLPNWARYTSAADAFQNLTSVPPGPAPINTIAATHHCAFWSGFGI